jgi:hypothetical protein
MRMEKICRWRSRAEMLVRFCARRERAQRVESPMARALRTEALTESRLEKLAHEPGVSVYKYTYDAPEGSMSASAQLTALQSIIAEFDGLTHAHPTESNEQLRERVLRAGGAARQRFQRLYAKVFAMVTVRVHSPADMDRLDKTRVGLLYMLQMRAAAGSDADTTPSSTLTATVMTTCEQLAMRDIRPGDLEAAQRVPLVGDGAAASGDEERMPVLQPLRRETLGPCLVQQAPFKASSK